MNFRINSIKKRGVMSILLFLIIFNPPIVKGLSFTILIIGLSIGLCFFEYKYLKHFILTSSHIRIFRYFIIFIFYIITLSLINIVIYGEIGAIIYLLIRTIVLLISLIMVSLCVSIIWKRKEYNIEDILYSFVYCGVMQSLISIMSFLSPFVMKKLNDIMVSHVNHENIARLIKNSIGVRCYGFASTLFDAFGFAMSLIAIIALFIAISGKRIFYFYFCMISFTAIINARTSIVMIAVGTFICVFNKIFGRERIKVKIEVILLSGIMMIMMIFLVAFFSKRTTSANAMWIMSGIESIKELIFRGKIDTTFRGANTNYFGIMINNFIFVPDNPLQLLFGTSMTPYDAKGMGSDIAYIQHLWQLGIFGSIYQYYIYLRIFRMGEKKMDKQYKGLCISMAFMLFVYLIKSEALSYGMPMLIIFPIIFYMFTINSN